MTPGIFIAGMGFAAFLSWLIYISLREDTPKKYTVLKNTPKTWPEDLPTESNQINPKIFGGITYDDGKTYEKIANTWYGDGTTGYKNEYLPLNIKELYDEARKEAEATKEFLEKDTIEEHEKDKESYKIAFTKFGDFLNIMARRGTVEYSSAIYLKNVTDITLFQGKPVRRATWVFKTYRDAMQFKVFIDTPAYLPRKPFVQGYENHDFSFELWDRRRIYKHLNQSIDFPVYAEDDRIVFGGIGMLLVPNGLGQEVFDKIMKAQEIDIGK